MTVGPAARPGERADAAWVRAQVAYERESPSRASILAMEAVAPILRIDPGRADSVLAEATWCARDAGDPELLRRCGDLLSVRSRARPARPALIGLTGLLHGDHAAAAPGRASCTPPGTAGSTTPVQRFIGGFLAVLIGEDRPGPVACSRSIGVAAAPDGPLGWLPYGQEALALAQVAMTAVRDAATPRPTGSSLAASSARPSRSPS